MRLAPNIVVTGTPGVGKTTLSESLAERTGLRHVSVNQVVKDKECHEGWSDEYQSWIVDEDKVSPSTPCHHSHKHAADGECLSAVRCY
jgi:adenylate kinase